MTDGSLNQGQSEELPVVSFIKWLCKKLSADRDKNQPHEHHEVDTPMPNRPIDYDGFVNNIESKDETDAAIEYEERRRQELSKEELRTYDWLGDYSQSPEMKKQLRYSLLRTAYSTDEEFFNSAIAKRYNIHEKPKPIPYTYDEIETVIQKCIAISKEAGFDTITESLESLSYSYYSLFDKDKK